MSYISRLTNKISKPQETQQVWQKTQKEYTYAYCMVESRAFPVVSMSFLWLMGFADRPMILAPQYYGTYSILVMQASKEASIQSLISFSSSYSVFLCILFLLDYLTPVEIKLKFKH